MNKFLLAYLFIPVLFICLSVFSPSGPSPVPVFHSSFIFDQNFFRQADKLSPNFTATPSARVLGGIIPHHLLAAPLISGFFTPLKSQNVTEVFLLTPNHYHLGPSPVITSKGTFTTIFGNLNPDLPRINKLLNLNTVSLDEDLFNSEHGIYAETPFIKRAFPNALLIPLVIRNGTSKDKLDALVSAINEISGPGSLIIVSADFSHYQPSTQADVFDKETLAAIKTFNPDAVLKLDSTKNVDSPESLYVLLHLMQLKKAVRETLVANTNSAKLTRQPNLESTTSYFTMYFSL